LPPAAAARVALQRTYLDGELRLAKLMESPLVVVWSQPLPAGVAPSTVTVSQDPAGR
jgi:putative transposase